MTKSRDGSTIANGRGPAAVDPACSRLDLDPDADIDLKLPRFVGRKNALRDDRRRELTVTDGWYQQCPATREYLELTQWEDGSPRQPSTVTIFVEHGLVKLCLHDRDQNRSCWVSGDSFEAAWASLEDGLAAGNVEWRERQGPRQK
jgi:hypothetical protein